MENEDKYIIRVRKLILDYLKDYDIKVLYYGSRARGDYRNTSDVDIGLIPGKDFKLHIISLLREALEESTIPYKVDVINLNNTRQEFQAEILKDAIIWKD